MGAMVGPEADTWLTPTTGRRVRDPCQRPPQGLRQEGAQQTLLWLLQGGMSVSVLNCEATQNISETM